MISVLFVCLGNICRSPMAEFILKNMVNQKGLAEKFYIDSAATSNYNEITKEGMYQEAKDVLKEMNVPYHEHFSRQIRKDDYEKFDYILGMEQKNIKDILRITGEDTKNKIFRLLDFSKKPEDVVDPYYYGNFDSTFYDIQYGCEEFLKFVMKKNSQVFDN